jgi:Ser/Thr protein kinase RdoA (MazF antagonist)
VTTPALIAELATLCRPFGGVGTPTKLYDKGEVAVYRIGSLVAKIQPSNARFEADLVRGRLRIAAHPKVATLLLPPLHADLLELSDGRTVTVWPYVETLNAGDLDNAPWFEAGALLGRLHSFLVQGERKGPLSNWPVRLHDFISDVQRLPQGTGDIDTTVIAAAARTVDFALFARQQSHPIHGDFHLGQLFYRPNGKVALLDIDDMGYGHPGMDLARFAAFYVLDLLAEHEWEAFLDGYRSTGDPQFTEWAELEPYARAMIVYLGAKALTLSAAENREPNEVEASALAVCRQLMETYS